MSFGRGRGPRNIVEPLNAAVLAMIPEKRPSSADPLARAILVTVIQMKAQPLAKMQTLLGEDVLLRQLRLVATGEFLRTASRAGFPGSEG